MKLFIYEHITSGAYADETLPMDLAREGYQMLLSTLSDASQIPNCSLLSQYDVRFDKPKIFDHHQDFHCLPVHSSVDYRNAWLHCMEQCDAVLVIAPEIDQSLLSIQQQAQKAKYCLGCSPEAIQQTGDKWACYQQLVNANIATPITSLATEWRETDFFDYKEFILKPRNGAGCSDTLYFESSSQLADYLRQLPHSLRCKQITQPYLRGVSGSLCLLTHGAKVEVLSINQQYPKLANGYLHLSETTVASQHPDLPSLAQATSLAQQVYDCFPGLVGLWGIDTLFSDGKHLVVDINPRLTTSFCSLNSILGINPIARLLNNVIVE